MKVSKFQEFVKIVLQSKTQQESIIRSKRGKPLEDSPTSTFPPSSKREKKRSKVTATLLFKFYPGYSLLVNLLFFSLEGINLGAFEKRFP